MTITTRWGNNLLDSGFLMVPNLLIDNQEELGLSDDELLFIIKTMRHQESYKIHDNQLSETLSSKTMQRRRKSLKDKGYLEVEIHKMQIEDGTWLTEGIVYNYEGLMIALNALDNKIKSERSKMSQNKTATSVLHNNNKILAQEKIPEEVVKYMDKYKTKYGVDYKLTNDEKLLLEKASPEFLRSIPFIFDYTDYQKEYGKLPSTFNGRLIFFQKVLWRQSELVAFADEEIEYLNRHN
jgi:hypothetical protein